MSNNYWQAQNNQNGQAGPGGPPRKSGLLGNYSNNGNSAAPLSPPPGNRPAPQGPPPSSPLPPPAPYQGNQPARLPAQQMPAQAQPQWNGPSFMARPVQMMQRLSNKMGAIRRPGPGVEPNPLVRYRGP